MKNLNWLRERLIDKLGSAESVSGSSEGSGYWRGRADVLRESLLIVDSMRDGQVDRRAVWCKSVERFGRDKQSIGGMRRTHSGRQQTIARQARLGT